MTTNWWICYGKSVDFQNRMIYQDIVINDNHRNKILDKSPMLRSNKVQKLSDELKETNEARR